MQKRKSPPEVRRYWREQKAKQKTKASSLSVDHQISS